MSGGVELQQQVGVLKPAGRSAGWLRVGESAAGRSALNVLLVHPDSDAAEDLVAGLTEAGVASVIWELDPRKSRSRARRRKEIQRIVAAGRQLGGAWVGVVPFTLPLARDLEKLVTTSRFVLLSDDVAVLWSGGEASHTSSLRALRASAGGILDMAVFIASSSTDRLILSARKSKEFPNQALRAVLDFFEVSADDTSISAGACILGRQQPMNPRVVAPQLTYQPAFKWGVDSIFKRGLVTGWIKRAMSNERLVVRIVVDGQVAAEGKAEYFRQKLFDLGIGDGSHAFAIDISSSLGATPKRVEIRTADGNFLLGEVMMTASVGKRLDDSLGSVELAN